MAQPSYAPVFSPVSVIGPQFVAPYQFDVTVMKFSGGELVITDSNQKIMFTVKSFDTSLHAQWLLKDANDTPILLFRGKIMSAHDRWNVYRGDSNADSDMIFSTVTKHMVQFSTHVNVFLANKTSGRDDCDFKIKGNWSKKNCTIYLGESSTIIAQMHKSHKPESKNKYMVTIHPNVDYAFVVALIAVVNAMETSSANEIGLLAGEGAGATVGYFAGGD